jgi:hypothetical protein
MHTHADKSQGNKSQTVADIGSEKQNGSESIFQFEESGPKAIAQRKLQELADNSPQVSKLRSIKEKADTSHTSGNSAQLKAMMGESAISADAPIQMIKPKSKAEAMKLSNGTVKKVKRDGQRHGGKHGGKEIREQLKKAGEDSAEVDAMEFMEYDVNARTDGERDAERVVIANNGRVFYTDKHYAEGSFVEIS